MGFNHSPSPPHLYSQALQLKLYQGFIFSIPILFSIILFLLFYLFYLKKRAGNYAPPPPPVLPIRTSNQAIFMASVCEVGLKEDVKDKLPKIMFDENLKARDSICCVCLGEFEMKEELNQLPSCKHLFHVDCIRHWLRSHTTCPLCRCSVVVEVADDMSYKPLVVPPQPPPPPPLPTPQSNLHQDNQQLQFREQVASSSSSSTVGSNVQAIAAARATSITISSDHACSMVSSDQKGHLENSLILHIQDDH